LDKVSKFHVLKASGKKEAYDRRKILGSLRRAGADNRMAEKILTTAEKDFYPGITTGKILSTVMELLEREQKKTACLYDLKGGMRRLGPAGFNFETYVGEILREYGHRVKLRQKVPGRCVSHEIDLVTESVTEDSTVIRLMECKFHRSPGTLVDLKEMMYTWARLEDINSRADLEKPYDGITIISNTRASKEARAYAQCQGMEILTWRHPPGGGLEELIRAKGLYPVTILPSVSSLKTDIFSRAGLMLVKDFPSQEPRDLAEELHISRKKAEAIIREAELVLAQDDR
jgi:hypothetical protein